MGKGEKLRIAPEQRADRQELAGFAGIMIAVGAVFGILSGHGLIIGALAGALLFGLICGVGWIGGARAK
jgi:predicted PurR-regulated permease PerM